MRLSLVVVVAIILQTTSTLLTANASSSPTHHSHSLRGRSDAASKTDTDDHKERVLKKNKNKSGDKKKKGDKKEKGDKKKKKKGEDLDEDDEKDSSDDMDQLNEEDEDTTPRVGDDNSNAGANEATGAGAGTEINCAQRTDVDEKDCEKGNEKLAEGSAVLNDFNTFLVECVTSLEAQCAELEAQGQAPAECAGNFGPRCRDEWLQNNN